MANSYDILILIYSCMTLHLIRTCSCSYCTFSHFLCQTPNEFLADFVRHLDRLNYPRSEALSDAIYVYDAVWAAAFALHNASETLKALPEPQELTDFTYERGDINAYILQAALGLDFRGVSVRLHV